MTSDSYWLTTNMIIYDRRAFIRLITRPISILSLQLCKACCIKFWLDVPKNFKQPRLLQTAKIYAAITYIRAWLLNHLKLVFSKTSKLRRKIMLNCVNSNEVTATNLGMASIWSYQDKGIYLGKRAETLHMIATCFARGLLKLIPVVKDTELIHIYISNFENVPY